ncbi:MFS general substrate transporter [Pseudovirgaria hyperparasitica]|uniref:MFS general substrate transporter n=1 Tax=Pseudovirgaria hyperparasitica TaxID=470096 RepID=A0A6A6VWP9_9PEZI|nr:MFS general substrate transporter [Pseudovirgaria hyperparasitica]KAF2754595.1 MFS general substrate transporter [Pseudovirgaria hyperparasitica]
MVENNGNERTPLLGRKTSRSSHGQEEALKPVAGPESDADLVNESAIERQRSYSSSHWLAPQVSGDHATYGDSEVVVEDEEGDGEFMGGVSRTRFWIIFGGMNLTLFVACFDATLMASSHPVITSYFNASNSASWLTTAFLLTSTAFQPLFGRVSDTFGRRPLYVFTLSLFIATTTWCALAQSIGSFIAARACCGLGAGGAMAMTAIMTNDLVRIEVRGTYQAYINLFFGLGQATGAAFGGYLAETLGWRWTFGVQVPPVILVLGLALFFTPKDLGPQLAKNSDKNAWEIIKSFDLAGSFLLSSTVAFLILGLNLGGNIFPWSHPLVITSLIVSVIASGILVWAESRHPRPVMPLAMVFTSPRGNLVFGNFFAQIGFQTIIFNAPIFFQAVKFDSPSQSGFRLALPSLCTMVCGISSGLYMTRYGRMKGLLVSGAIFTLLGGVLATVLWENVPMWFATAAMAPGGIGVGLSFPASTIAVLSVSAKEDQAVMSSTLTLWRSLGIVMGVALSSLILQSALSAYLEKLVTGPHKAEIIRQVRSSVRSISDLDLKHQAQVISAYRQSLTLTFALSIVAYLIVFDLTVPVKLPRLGKHKEEEDRPKSPSESTPIS